MKDLKNSQRKFNYLKSPEYNDLQLVETLREKSQNVFELKAGTLYPLLHGLEEKGLLTVYEQEYAGKTRKYYSITKNGESFLKKKKEEWEEYQAAVANVLALEC